MREPTRPMLRTNRRSLLLATTPFAIVVALAGWLLLLPIGVQAVTTPGQSEPPAPQPPVIFLVDSGAVVLARGADHGIGIRARLTVGRLADKPEGDDLNNYCPNAKSVEATADDDIFYCYRLENVSDQTLITHTLVDSRFSVIFEGRELPVIPGATVGGYKIGKAIASATDYMTWTAFTEAGEPLSDFSQATVVVPTLMLTATAGLDPAACATTDPLMMPSTGDAVYCLRVYNPNDVALEQHQAFRASGEDVPLPPGLVLEPGETTFVTFTAPVTEPTTSGFVWRAQSVTRATPVTATAAVDVRTPHITTALFFGYAGRSDCLSSVLTATIGSSVLYCYFAINDGSVAFDSHVVTESVYGKVDMRDSVLEPDKTLGIGITRTATATTTSKVTWRAIGAGTTVEATALGTLVAVMPARLDVRPFVDNGVDPPNAANGVPGILIEITDPAGVTSRKTSDDFGVATFTDLIPGTYKVEVIDASKFAQVTPLNGTITTTLVIEGATAATSFAFTGTVPPRYQHLPLIQR